MEELLFEKFGNKAYECKEWCEKAEEYLSLCTPLDYKKVCMEEMVHYHTWDQIISGFVDPHAEQTLVQKAFMDRPLYETKVERDAPLKSLSELGLEGVNGQRCPACGSQKTYTFTKQHRSSDEPSTDFTFCHDCGKQSKKNN